MQPPHDPDPPDQPAETAGTNCQRPEPDPGAPTNWEGAPPWAQSGPWQRRRGPFGPWPDGPGTGGPGRYRGWPPAGRRHPGWIFARFAGVFGLLALLLLGGLGLLIFFVVRLAGGDRQTAALLWFGTCGLLLVVPGLVVLLGRRAFRSIARPLSSLMDAADRVAAGDLTVRVTPGPRGDFAQLADSFNHMVEELALADQRRRNLTADVAHELRTPLQIIQGNLEGIVDGVYAPTTGHIAATLEETRVLARLVEDLRVLSQAEAGQLPMQREPIHVDELLTDVVTSFSGQAQAAGISLRSEVSGVSDVPASAPASLVAATGAGAASNLVVNADYGRLEQVLGNLTANALRHTPAGGSVVLAAAAQTGGVQISVADTGEGIPAADLPFVFDRFWRGDRARTHGLGAGSGLGLAIARELVQAHGGEITVASTPGAGTRFTIDLPQS